MILLINACVRKQSRTKRLADSLLAKWSEPVTEIRLEEIDFPGNIHVIREVTNDYAYQNYSLALFMPEED